MARHSYFCLKTMLVTKLIVYFYNILSGIETTYDKLFLMAGYNTNNVTQAFGLGKGYGEYIFYDGDPEDLLRQIHIIRKLKLQGVILFDWAHLNSNYLEVLKTSVFKPQTY